MLKMLLFLLFVMLLYMPTFAQSHLNFEGIPITGQVDNFVTNFRYKDIYARKYGEPLSVECFSGEYYDGHGYELEALSYGECSYTSSYDTLNGLIRVVMFDSGCIWIHYIDNAGAALMNNEASDDE